MPQQPGNKVQRYLGRPIAFIGRWAWRILGTLIICSAVFVAVAQTSSFKSWLKDRIVNVANDALEGKLVIDEAYLDVFKGIVLRHPRLYANGTTVLEAHELSVSYDLAALSGRVLSLSEVHLSKPVINIARSKDGVWNVDRIVKPDPDTTTSDPPDITISLRALKISNGSVLVNDMSTKWSDGKRFDPLHISLHDVNLNMSFRVNPKAEDVAVAINRFACTDMFGPVDITDMKLVVRATKEGVDLQSLNISTPKSIVRARCAIADVNLFDGFSDSLLASHPVRGHIEADPVSGEELHFYVPEVDLAGNYELVGDATFNGNGLDVSAFTLRSDDIRASGYVRIDNLDGKTPLKVDIEVNNSQASYQTVKRKLKFVELPDLPFLKRSDLHHVHLKGDPERKLDFEFDVADKPGRATGQMTLILNKKELGYQLDVMIKGGDVSAISSDTTMPTFLNGRVMMIGEGTTLQTMSGTTQIELDRSRLFNRPLRKFRAIVRSDGHGRHTVDTLFADVTPFSTDTTQVDLFDEFTTQRISLAGFLDVHDTNRPIYQAAVEATGLDVASLFDDPSLPSRLSWVGTVDASGVEIDSILGSAQGKVTEFMLEDRALMPFDVHVSQSVVPEGRRLFVSTGFARLDIVGQFYPSRLTEAVLASITSVKNAVAERLHSFIENIDVSNNARYELQPFDANINITVDDLSPINMFVPDVTVSGAVTLDGRMNVTTKYMDINFDKINTQYLSIVADSLDIYVEPVYSEVDIYITNLQSTPRVNKLDILGHCDSTIRVGDKKVFKPRISIRDSAGIVDVVGESWYNTMFFAVDAKATVTNGDALVHLNTTTFKLDTVKKLVWELQKPSDVKVRDGSFTFDKLSFTRLEAETVVIDGTASKTAFNKFSATVEKFSLKDVNKFVDITPEHPLHLLNGLVDECVVVVDGAWETPVIVADINVSNVSYNSTPIGQLTAQIEHENKVVSGKVLLDDKDDKSEIPTMTLDITSLPLDLAFADVENRLVEGGVVDVDLNAPALPLTVIEPFLPAVERVRGTAKGSITLKGVAPKDIKLGGQARFKHARMLSSSTNLEYIANGVMHLEGQDLFIDTVYAYNTSQDLKGGVAIATGVVNFDGFEVKSYDFNITTPTEAGIKVLNRASQARNPNVFGDLIIASGANPIHLHGTTTNPWLEGDIVVLYADITFPQERSKTKSKYGSVTYLRNKDKDSAESDRRSIWEYYNPVVTAQQDSTTDSSRPQNMKSRIERAIEAATPSFADNINYNLKIRLKGRTLMTMILSFLEILVVDLELKDPRIPLHFTGKFANNSTNLKGAVRVKEGASTYQFYKPFRASGTLDFGYGGLTNPSLNLKAVYENRRTKEGTDQQETYKVELTITGTKQSPRIAYRLWRNEREVVDDSAKIAADALMLILVGKTQDELFQSGQGNIANQTAFLSAAANSALGDILGDMGGVAQSVTVDLSEDFSTSMVTVSGQIVGDVSYRVTGQMSDLSGNSTFTVTVPLSVLNDDEALRNFRFDLSHTVNNTGNVTRQTRLWEIKFGVTVP